MDTEDEKPARFENIESSTAYVAFMDVLRFSRFIEDDFDGAVGTYEILLEHMGIFDHVVSVGDFFESVSVRIYSDAILVTCPELLPLLKAVNLLNMVSLSSNCLVRGGIGYGRHVDQESGTNTYVVSQALSRAVAVEKHVDYPCVALHPSVVVPDEYWQGDEPNLYRPLLYFDGIALVNPFSLVWGTSARGRVEMMRDEYPNHREKYDWFIKLFEAVFSDELLVPEFLPSDDSQASL